MDTSFLSLQRGSSTNGAFVSYSQRGSVQSLPDAALMQINTPTSIISNFDSNSNTFLATKQDINKNLHKNQLTEPYFGTELELNTLVDGLKLNTNLVKFYFYH